MNTEKIKNLLADAYGYIYWMLLLAALIYACYFFYQNFYLVVSEKTPLEQTAIKETLDMELYEKIKSASEAKKSVTADREKIEGLFN